MALLDEIQVRVYKSRIKIPLVFFVPALTLLSLYSLAYFHVNTPHFWRLLEAQLHDTLGGQYQLGHAEVAPDLSSVRAWDVQVATPEGEPVIEVDRVDASIDPLMLLTGRLEFDRGRVQGADVRLEYDDGSLNLLDALGITERLDEETPDDTDRGSVGFSDIAIEDAQFEFVDQNFGFSIDEVDIPKGSVFIEPTTVLMNVDRLAVPEVDFWFEPQLFRFPPEQGRWEFTARDTEVDNWRWVNDGFTVERVATNVDAVELEASGRMVFPGDEADTQMAYDAEGSVRAGYHTSVFDYFTDGNVRFGIANADIEVAGNLDEIEGRATDVHLPAAEINDIHLQQLRGDVELDNRVLIAEQLSGQFYGGQLEADNAFFNMLDQHYGADVFFEGVNPRPFLEDVTGDDQPFVGGSAAGGLRLVGEMPPTERPEPKIGYPLAYAAMARFATINVLEPVELERDNDELFPNQRLVAEPGGQFWFDQHRMGVDEMQIRSGRDQFGLRDFVLDYDTLHFQQLADAEGAAQVTGQIDEIAEYATYYDLDGLEGPAEFTMTMEGFFGSPQWRLDAEMRQPAWRIGADRRLEGEQLELQLAGSDGDIEVQQFEAITDFGRFDVSGTAGWYEPLPPDGPGEDPPIWEDRVVQPLDLQVGVEQLDTAEIAPLIDEQLQVSGPLDATIGLSGSYQAMVGEFQMQLGEGAIYDQPVDQLSTEGGFDSEGVWLERAVADLGVAGQYDGHGRLDYDGRFELQLEGEEIELGELRPLGELELAPQGEGRFYLEGQGTLEDPEFSGGGQLEDLRLVGEADEHDGLIAGDDGEVELSLGDVALTAETIDGIVHLSGGLLPWLTVAVELPLQPPAPYYVRFGMEQLELMEMIPELGDHPIVDDVRASGTTEVYFERDFSRHQAIFNLAELNVDARGQEVANVGNVIIGLNNGEVLTFQRAGFESGGRHFSLEGALGLDPQILDIQVDGELDLALLESAQEAFPEFFPDFFVGASGYADAEMALRGTPEQFSADGTVLLDDSEWSLRFLPEPMVIESGRLDFGEEGLEIPEDEPLEGTLLGGSARMAGSMGYLEEHPRRLDMQLWSHNMSHRIPGLATLAFDTNLQFEASDWQDFDTWLISGDVDFLDGVYHQEFNVVEQEIAGRVIGAFQPRTEQYEAGLLEAFPLLEDLEFDMNLTARDGFRLDTQVDRLEADLEFRFDLHLQNTLANPRVTGDVDVLDGEVGFQGEAFEVRSGTVSFTEEVSNPHLDIEAAADVRNTCEQTEFVDEVSPAMMLTSNIEAADMQQYHVMLNMHGELENLSVELESNPYADQRDILSMLLTGCTVDQLTATGASRPTLEVALGPLLGRLEREIAEVVAVDELTITPGVERTQVRVSNRLSRQMNWHFFLDTGFGDAVGGQQAQLEWRLSDRWTAELSERSYNEAEDLLIDLKLNYRLPLD